MNGVAKCLQRALVLIALSVCVYCIHIKAEVWPLVLTGDAIPGTANYRFTGFTHAVVNTSGTIAFSASFVDPATQLPGTGIFEMVGGQVLPVALSGQALPDGSGAALGVLTEPAINDLGDIVFVAFTNQNPQPFAGVFAQAGGVLQRVADFNTAVPGAPGEHFTHFGAPQINNQGHIVFDGQFVNNSTGAGVPLNFGIFLFSAGQLQSVELSGAVPGSSPPVGGLDFFNNNDQISAPNGSGSGIVVVSTGGSITNAVSFPVAVPGTSYTADIPGSSSINDDGDLAFVGIQDFPGARFGTQLPVAILRWSSGTITKIAAAGDPVPGFPEATFDTEFLNAHVNESAAIFKGHAKQTQGIIGKSEQGQLSVLATENQYVDGIGTLDSISDPNFDSQQGKIVTFIANANAGSEAGIYAVSTAPQYTLRFPHIANGGGNGLGGWQTTFILTNRSATAANVGLSFYDDNGNALRLDVGGRFGQNHVALLVPALGVAEVQTRAGGPLTQGWALVQSDQSVTGSAIFSLLDGSGNTQTEVGVPASLPLNSISVFAQNGTTTSTGVALANPNNTAATVTLTLKDSNSTQLDQTTITIPPLGHIARYASELFSAIPPGEFQGKIEVLSTQPLAGLTLRQKGSIFTSLPVIP